MQLSNHFFLEEFVVSQEATRRGIDNAPPNDVIARLGNTSLRLESIRDLLRFPIHISSGYRCPKLNAVLGGAPDSAHLTGDAADFLSPRAGTPYQIVGKIMASGIKFDQLINEGVNAGKGYGGWVHISFAPALRQQILTASFDGAGKATYIDGLRGTA